MLDAEYLKKAISFAKASSYSGFTVENLLKHLEGADCSDEGFNKFIYHMDEIWSAGLFRITPAGTYSSRWGLSGTSGGYSITSGLDFVLTPAGDVLLTELNSPKGLQKFIDLIKRGSGIAGEEALKFAVQTLFEG